MLTIPQEVLEQVERGNVVLFIGEGITLDTDGRHLVDQLTDALAIRAGMETAEVKDFPEAAQAYEDKMGRQELLHFLRQRFVANGDKAQQAHHLIARLKQCHVLVTTCLDQGVEQAFSALDRPLDVITANGDAPMGDDHKAQLYRLCGSLAQGESLLLTEDDYEAFFEATDSIPTLLKGHLARRVILFVGYDIANGHFKRLYRKVTTGLDNQARHSYAVAAAITAKELRWCERHQVEPITAEPIAFLQALTEQIKARVQVEPVATRQPVTAPSLLPERPYKLLDYYEAQDAGIFFGREQETQLLSSLIHAHRLVLLYGASGTGKTSLLLAGVGPFLERVESPYQLIYVRALEDPALAIRRAVRWRIPAARQDRGSDSEKRLREQEGLLEALRQLMDRYFNESEVRDLCFSLGIDYEGLAKGSKRDNVRELIAYGQRHGRLAELIAAGRNLRPHVSWPKDIGTDRIEVPAGLQNTLKEDGPLVDFLDAATRILKCTLIIVLDQFEEFFIRLSPQFRAAFIAELGTLYDARDVPVKVLLSLREDWLAAVGEIEERIPEVFRNRTRLLPLGRQQAGQAITAPAGLLGISYEPELVEQLLADLMGRESAAVMPPQLQLVCSALYGGLGAEEHLITLAAYEQLGGARGVLQKYLADELARFGREERIVARVVLEELVTSQGTKAVKTGEEVAIALDSDLPKVRPVLEKLVRARLLRALEREDGEVAYELAHEYLIREINVGSEAQARKQTEELIKQEVENWQRFSTSLAADKLALIGELREALRLTPEAQELLLHSALQVGHEVEYWLERISDPERRTTVLAATAQNKVAVVRQRAAQALGTQDVPASVEPLLMLAVHDADPSVRTTARESLAKLTEQRPAAATRLQSELEQTNRSIRRATLETLTVLPLRGLSPRLRWCVLATRLRLYAAWLIAVSLATSARRAVALTSIVLLLLLILAYTFSASAYYVDIRPSPILNEPSAVVIHRGHPLLLLPGLDQELVDTGINTAQLAPEHWNNVNQKRVWGFWSERSGGGYRKWGEDIYAVLELQAGTRLFWYLDQAEGFSVLLEAAESQVGGQQLDGVMRSLGQLGAVQPEVAAQVVDVLLGLLSNEDGNIRFKAVAALGQVGAAQPEVTAQVVDVLLGLLTDGDSNMRFGVAIALGRVGAAQPEVTAQVMDALVGLLSDKSSNVRSSAAYALGQIGVDQPEVITTQVVDALLGLLSNEDGNVRNSTTVALGKVGAAQPQVAAQVVDTLVGLLGDGDSNVRDSTADVLGQVGAAQPEVAAQVVDALVGLLSDENFFVRFSAADALGKVGAAQPEVTAQVMDALLRSLSDKSNDVRSSAADALGQIGSAQPKVVTAQVVDALVGLLSGEDFKVRSSVQYALGQVGAAQPEVTDQVVDVLFGLLNGEDIDVFFITAYSLGQVGATQPEVATQVMGTLVGLLSDEDSNVRSRAVYALGQVGVAQPEVAAQVMDALLRLLSNEDSNVRNSATDALGQVGAAQPKVVTVQVLDALLRLLSNEDSNVRDSAANALGQVGAAQPKVVTIQVVDALLRLLSNEDSNMRDSAADALVQVYTHQTLQTDGNNALLFNKLTDPLSARERPVAAHALFLVVLHDPERSQDIRGRLEELSTSHEPIARLWANITLQMLDLVDLAHTAADTPSQQEEITDQLSQFTQFDFFGEDFTWAAQEALNWLAEQEQEGLQEGE
jgi:HEAT repeat protein